MTRKRQDYMKQADRHFAKYIRSRDGKCLSCGTKRNLQCAHIISRSYKSIRTDERNAITLCQSCHLRFTHRPLEWRDWVEKRFPGRWEELKWKALGYERVSWKTEAERWRDASH